MIPAGFYRHNVRAIYPAMRLASRIALTSQCDRAKVGCAFVGEDATILVASNNHSHGGMKKDHSCVTNGHYMVDSHCCATVHAEIACIVEAMKNALSLEKSACVITHTPCMYCSIALIEVGIKLLYIKERYREDSHMYKMLIQKGIKVFDWNFNALKW